MKGLLWIAVLIGLVLGGKHLYERAMATHDQGAAEDRVRAVLEKIRSGSTVDEQIAIGQWAKGSPLVPEGELRALSGPFDSWRREKGIYTLREFRIDEVAAAGEGFRVSVTVDGRKLQMLVRKGSPIAWAS